VFIDENNLFILTEKDNVIYVFNVEKLTISKTKMSEEQAFMLPHQYKVQVVNNYLVYDNIIMIGHGQFVSVCDLNAGKCNEKPWRHLKPTVADERTATERFDLLKLDSDTTQSVVSTSRTLEFGQE